MSIYLLLILGFLVFLGYRYQHYKKQRHIEQMATDAQAYVSSEIVELLQRFKTIESQKNIDAEMKDKLANKIHLLTNNLFCHTDNEASVREYLSYAKQDITLIKLELDQLTLLDTEQSTQQFDMLK